MLKVFGSNPTRGIGKGLAMNTRMGRRRSGRRGRKGRRRRVALRTVEINARERLGPKERLLLGRLSSRACIGLADLECIGLPCDLLLQHLIFLLERGACTSSSRHGECEHQEDVPHIDEQSVIGCGRSDRKLRSNLRLGWMVRSPYGLMSAIRHNYLHDR